MNIQNLNKAIPDIHKKYAEKLQALMAKIEIDSSKGKSESEMKVLKALSFAMTSTLIGAAGLVAGSATVPILSAALGVGVVSLGKAMYHANVERTLSEKVDKLKEDYESGELEKELNKVSLWEKVKEAARQTLLSAKVAEQTNIAAPELKTDSESIKLQATPEARNTPVISATEPSTAVERSTSETIEQSLNPVMPLSHENTANNDQTTQVPGGVQAIDSNLTQNDIDKTNLRAVEKNSNDLTVVPLNELDELTARELVSEDLASFAKIKDPSERYFAAVALSDNAKNQSAYKDELQSQDPQASKEIASAYVENERRIEAKENRKTAELQGFSELTTTAESPESIPTGVKAIDPAIEANENPNAQQDLNFNISETNNSRINQDDIDKASLRAIEKNNDGLIVVPVNALDSTTAREMVSEDLISLAQIKGSTERHFAAVAIGDNARNQSAYKDELQSQDPQVEKELTAANKENERRSAEKEDRKEAELQGYNESAVTAESPELIQTGDKATDPAIKANQAPNPKQDANISETNDSRLFQLDIDKVSLRAIEKNSNDLTVVPLNELDQSTAREMVSEDLISLAQIKGSTERHFAAVAIGDNAKNQSAYQDELQSQDPQAEKEISAAYEEKEPRIAAKENRKAAELQGISELTAPAESPDLIQTVDKAIDPALDINKAPIATLVISQETLDRLAATRAQDSAVARVTLQLNTVEPNLEKEQHKLAGEGEANRSAWLKKAEEAKVSQANIETPKTENILNSDETFTAGDSVKVKPVIPAEIESQYHQKGDKFYHPKTPELVAFEDKGNKLETKSDSQNISLSLVQIAQARGWNEIKISGSEKFRQEVWLEASVRGMAVKGYTPNEADKAQVNKRISEIKPNQVENVATVFADAKKPTPPEKVQTEIADSKYKRMADAIAKEPTIEALKKYPELAGAVAVAVAIDKQAQAAGMTPEQRAIGAAYVREKLANSIERGDIPPPVIIRVPVEVKREASEDIEVTR